MRFYLNIAAQWFSLALMVAFCFFASLCKQAHDDKSGAVLLICALVCVLAMLVLSIMQPRRVRD